MRKTAGNAKRTLALIVSLVFIMSLVPMTVLAAPFSDAESHWASEVIDKWSGYSVLKGYTDGTFKPDDFMTRAEFATVLDNVMKYATEAENKFDDVNGEWFEGYVLRLYAAEVIKGTSETEFSPGAQVTREQAATMISRMFNIAEDESAVEGFEDADKISDYARGPLGGMINNGYLKGYPDNTLKPKDNLKRAEAVQLIDNVVKAFYNEAGTYTLEAAEGIVVVNTADVILENGNLEGSLYVTQGVGEGDFTLENSEVSDLYVQGGGVNSVKLRGSKVKGLKVKVDKSTGDVRIDPDEASEIETATVQKTDNAKAIFNGVVGTLEVEGESNAVVNGTVGTVKAVEGSIVEVSLDGDVQTITVEAGSTVVVKGNVKDLTIIGENVTILVDEDATVENLSVEGADAKLDVKGTVTNVTLDETAENAELTISGTVTDVNVGGAGAKIDVTSTGAVTKVSVTADNANVSVAGKVDNVVVAASNATVGGAGKVTNIKVESGEGNAVTVPGAKVEVGKDAGEVKTGDNTTVKPGQTGTVPGGSTGGGSTGGDDGGGTYVPPTPPAVASVSIDKTAPVFGDTLTANVTYNNGTGAVTYKWFYADSVDGATATSLGTEATQVATAETVGKVVFVVVTGSGTTTGEATSDAVTIGKKSIEDATVALDKTETVYSGIEQSATITSVKLGGVDVTYTLNATDSSLVGTDVDEYEVIVNGAGVYTGTATSVWKITPKELTVAYVDENNKVKMKSGASTPDNYTAALFKFVGFVDGETAGVDLNGATVTFAGTTDGDHNLTFSKAFKFADLATADINNYTIKMPTTLKGTIYSGPTLTVERDGNELVITVSEPYIFNADAETLSNWGLDNSVINGTLTVQGYPVLSVDSKKVTITFTGEAVSDVNITFTVGDVVEGYTDEITVDPFEWLAPRYTVGVYKDTANGIVNFYVLKEGVWDTDCTGVLFVELDSGWDAGTTIIFDGTINSDTGTHPFGTTANYVLDYTGSAGVEQASCESAVTDNTLRVYCGELEIVEDFASQMP